MRVNELASGRGFTSAVNTSRDVSFSERYFLTKPLVDDARESACTFPRRSVGIFPLGEAEATSIFGAWDFLLYLNGQQAEDVLFSCKILLLNGCQLFLSQPWFCSPT